MRVQIVANVARLARPLFEGDELLLGLTHVRVKVAELAQLLLDALLGIGVHGVVTLVHLNGAEHVVLVGELGLSESVSVARITTKHCASDPHQSQVFGQGLDGGLGDQHVQASIHRLFGNVKVQVICAGGVSR
jgi:hypothetical protein